MGTGKTAIGYRVARSLGFRFVDLDHMIEDEQGMKIPEIFERSGESAFRDMERAALAKAAAEAGAVISTGGGLAAQQENLPLLQDSGYVIWLRASAETIFERTSRNANRPLLQTADPMQTIRTLLAQREDLYRRACQFDISTDDLSLDEAAAGVAETARYAMSGGL